MKVEDLIKHYNGYHVWNFSHPEFASQGGLKEGVCAALCACWIRYHSHNDSLANYISSEQKTYLNKQLARYMARLNAFLNPKGFHVQALALFFKMHGLIPLYSSHERVVLSFPEKEVREKLSYRKKRMTYYKGYEPQIEARIIHSLIGLGNCYAVILFESARSSHVVSVWLGRLRGKVGDATLFDATLGEIWFSSRQDFIRFFSDFFNTFYKPKGFNYSWAVLPFAPA